jgi:hypothetical protein
LDREGELIIRLRKLLPPAAHVATLPQTITFRVLASAIDLNVTPAKFDLAQTKEVSLLSAQPQIEELARIAQTVYAPITDALEVESTARVGCRFAFLAPADSFEVSDKFFCRAVRSPMWDTMTQASGGQLIDGHAVAITEDPETGHRRRMQVFSAITKPGGRPFYGLGHPEGKGGVLVDIDSFMRPERGHHEKLAVFVNESYLGSQRAAKQVLSWMLDYQKAPQ